jgi:hypothetical protein
MEKEATVLGQAKRALEAIKAGKDAAGRAIAKAYKPIKSISPQAIGTGLVAGHIIGGYSGSAAAQATMYHTGYNDAMKKQAGVGAFITEGVNAARGFVTRSGNSARATLAKTSTGQSVLGGLKRGADIAKANPAKTGLAVGVAGGLAARSSMSKSAGLARRSLALVRLYGRKAPTLTKIVGGTVAGGVGLGVTHVADEQLDGAAGKAAVYNFRKNNGSI